MNGTFLAVPLAFALLALFVLSKRKDARGTRKTHEEEFVTREELEAELKRHRDELEWEWTEMYDKFNKLHLRLSKRDQRKAREQQAVDQEEFDMLEARRAPRSVLPYKRMGP